ncbi:methyltransferase small [Shewanella sediminis HAW-EB3]|uniref:tRNA1(Val) (adenine(37)-N6)-methyltransferase n=1 Tax=Shewanella sediminis (strain HAW-EB3) TaxID=425104 RepID=TRMN6_SHESH|nr:methyltransferase [Shewanella sediminis]A8FRM9.1 RecName: Full=tRNA1(Val) (adenine(37)-N6)-methyltransferase; AltName: Full=tRNA m6A37 methyltransferase [Shewanella sediminis HAW-EB3]ABV35502.1 methyltransferase small [Shewanella sediminis HAW-EB3]
MAFTFKQFHIDDFGCGMPVSTDAVILGAWAPLSDAQNILDIGAGSGLLSLMATQRSNAKVTSIELDDTAVNACQKNFEASPWTSRLTVKHSSVQEFSKQHQESEESLFDHIICNPPYFKGGTQSQNRLRAQARHTDTLDFCALLEAIGSLLAPNGTASLILPSQSMSEFGLVLADSSLEFSQVTDISDSQRKTPHRHLFTLCHKSTDASAKPNEGATEHFCIKELDGSYTEEMKLLITGFYLKY